MRISRRATLAGLAAAPASSRFARAQEARLVLGTATPGGGFPVYGAALVAALRSVDPGLAIAPRNTAGSTENVPLVERGELDLGLVTGEVLHEALSGAAGRPPARVRVLSAMYSQPGLFVVRADSPARAVDDLRGRPVAFGARGSGLVVLARYVLDGMGLDLERDFRPIFLDRAGDGPAMVIERRADALWGAGQGWPGFAAVAGAPGGARFLAPDAAQARAIRAKYPFLKSLLLPARTYPGQDAPVASVGSWSCVIVRSDLDEALAYRLARAFNRAEPALAANLAQAAETTSSNTVAAVATPDHLHPGAARYLRDAGYLR
jgi:uncharacterized protein